MNICSYRPLSLTMVDSKGINERFKTLFTAVCFLQGSGGGGIQSVVAGTGITVDNTDPANPIVASTSSSVPISALTAATASNTVNLGAFRQQWNPSGVGNILGSISMNHNITTLTTNHKNIYLNMTGAHAASGVVTHGIWINNAHTGTNSENIGIVITANGATTNTGLFATGTEVGVRGVADIAGIAGRFDKGRIETGSATFNNGRIDFKGVTSGTAILTVNNVAGTPTLTLPIITGTVVVTPGLTSGRIPFASTGGLLVDDTRFQYKSTDNYLQLVSTGGGVTNMQSVNVGGYTISAFYANGYYTDALSFVQPNNSVPTWAVVLDNRPGIDRFVLNYTPPGPGTTVFPMLVSASGNISNTQSDATAGLHLKAGTASAGTAPEKYSAGTLLTAIEPLTREANANSLYGSNVALNRYAEGGVVKDFITTVDNGTTVETDLYTYTTKASTLAADGEKLKAEYSITLSDATADKVIKIYFAGTEIYTSGTLVATTGFFGFNVLVIRTGASTARATVLAISGVIAGTVATGLIQTDLTGLTFTNTNILKITGTASGASGGSGDISAKMGTIFWYGAANN